MSREKQNRYYDIHLRNPEARVFYNSKEWKKARKQALIRDHYLCQECLKEKKLTVADMVHHIIELLDNWDLGLTLSNLMSLCYRCHNKIHTGSTKDKVKVSNKIQVIEIKANKEMV